MAEPIQLFEGQGRATDEEMRSAVERWASARGFDRDNTAGGPPWWVGIWGMSVSIQTPDGGFWMVPAHAALVWALVLEARPLRDGSTCKRCDGCGRVRAVEMDIERATALPDGGLSIPVKSWAPARDPSDRFSGRCSTCEGTGIEDLTDEFAQHVLDAQPQQQGHPAVYVWTKPGSQASIEALHVLADRLQEWECTACYRSTPPRAGGCRYCGEPLKPNPLAPLGLHIGVLLAGRGEGTTDTVAQLEWRTSIRVSQRGEGDGSS